MKIWTSYFSNWRNFPQGAVPISITRFPPKGYKGLEYDKLAPQSDKLMDLKYGLLTKPLFSKMYMNSIEQMSKEEVIAELEKLSGGADVILLCYEKSGDFCHRHLVGEWLGAKEL